jgi:DNA-binding response OmpR family regulator
MIGTSPRILVIDDEIDTVNLVKMVLQRAGYVVYTATTWDEILSCLRSFAETKEIIDLVVLDIMMPDRSGFDVMLILQVVLHPVPPVIFLTAKIGMNDMVKASDMGAVKYLTKPTTPEKLVTAVKDVLSRRKKAGV